MLQILRLSICLFALCFVRPLPATDFHATNNRHLGDVVWVEQKALTKRFYFRVAFPNIETESWEDRPAPVAIRVFDRASGRQVQTIQDFESASRVQPDPPKALAVLDANFDGYADISIAGSDGGAGPNNTINFFLFNPRTGHFEFDEALSSLPQISIEKKTKTVRSAGRGGCCQHSSETFRYVQGKLVQISSWDESITADGKWAETTNCRLMRDKMQCKTTRKRTPENY